MKYLGFQSSTTWKDINMLMICNSVQWIDCLSNIVILFPNSKSITQIYTIIVNIFNLNPSGSRSAFNYIIAK